MKFVAIFSSVFGIVLCASLINIGLIITSNLSSLESISQRAYDFLVFSIIGLSFSITAFVQIFIYILMKILEK
ncbi:MAG: hypothetical protein ACP5OG_02265 [Candidatus Nanoarchaeia archaeon]